MQEFRAPFIILPKGVDASGLTYGSLDSIHRQVVFFRTESGWSNKELWRLLAVEFSKRITKAHPDLSETKVFVLFIDCALSHIDAEALKIFKTHHIEIIFLPAKSTSILQWLDVYFHGPLQKKIRAYLGEQYDNNFGDLSNEKNMVQRVTWKLSMCAKFTFLTDVHLIKH